MFLTSSIRKNLSKVANVPMHMIKNANQYTFQFQFSKFCFYSYFNLNKTIAVLNDKHYGHFMKKSNVRDMAGHAKWQNVKHIKSEKDQKKAMINGKIVWLIGIAIKEGGSDPKINSKLASILEEARKNNVPNATIERALKKGTNKKTKPGQMEILGPGGSFLLLEFETDNISTTRHEIKTVCKKHGANIMSTEGRWRAVFDQKGIVKAVKHKEGHELDADKALDIAIEAGAEEVLKKNDETGKTCLEFLSAPNDIFLVKKEVEKHYEVEEAYVGYLPTNYVELDDETGPQFEEFLEELESLPDVVRIFENVQ